MGVSKVYLLSFLVIQVLQVVPGEIFGEKKDGEIFGEKKDVPPCEKKGMSFAVNLWSKKIETFRDVKTWGDCSDFCELNLECKVWTWQGNKMDCTIYRATGVLFPEANAVSGPRSCVPNNDQKPLERDPKNTFNVISTLNAGVDEEAIFTNENATVPSLWEGDIEVSPSLIQQINIMKAAGDDDDISAFDAINRGQWPNGVVPYTYASGTQYRLQGAVNLAVADYNRYTCIRWKYYSPSAIRRFRHYVTFFIGGGCYSMIGRQGAPQRISLGNGCAQKGVTIHEMMHALGFFHEQSRRDRDTYIRINWRNIPRRLYYNFEKYRPGQASTLGFGYDKKSIMHYGNYAFSTNRQPTIVSLANSNERLGQRNGLSAIDIKQLNKYYNCKGTTGGGGKEKEKEKENKNCKDGYPFCKVLSDWCSNSWVKANCKKKCKICKTTVPKNCVDRAQHCVSWTRSGYCRSAKFKTYMTQNCAKSCKAC